jgi:hypothetical protein
MAGERLDKKAKVDRSEMASFLRGGRWRTVVTFTRMPSKAEILRMPADPSVLTGLLSRPENNVKNSNLWSLVPNPNPKSVDSLTEAWYISEKLKDNRDKLPLYGLPAQGSSQPGWFAVWGSRNGGPLDDEALVS